MHTLVLIQVHVFELIIRALGGLLSGHVLVERSQEVGHSACVVFQHSASGFSITAFASPSS